MEHTPAMVGVDVAESIAKKSPMTNLPRTSLTPARTRLQSLNIDGALGMTDTKPVAGSSFQVSGMVEFFARATRVFRVGHVRGPSILPTL